MRSVPSNSDLTEKSIAIQNMRVQGCGGAAKDDNSLKEMVDF